MDYVKKANEIFSQKYHCSQAVLAAFASQLGITEKQALKLGGCFGAGMCKGEVCGAVTGGLMALGLKYGQCEIEDLKSKDKTNEVAREMLERFKNQNGSYICRELLGCDVSEEEGIRIAREKELFTKFCPKMVESATRITEELMECEFNHYSTVKG